jgi:5'-methylthioadenosine phosphorylase
MAFGKVGIIGGSGLGAALGGLGTGVAHQVDTPFGAPSGPIVETVVDGVPVLLLARHGQGHLFNPSRVPYRANLYALKHLGATHVLASAAAGSLREEIAPGDLVLPDQVIDRTFRRPATFFDELAVHVEFAQPFCPSLRQSLLAAGQALEAKVHAGGTYVCMEGPQLSTRAESEQHRAWGADLIGMTLMPEAKLAREAELCYAAVSLPTDYDCWRPAPAELGGMELLKEIASNLRAGTERALALIRRALPTLAHHGEKSCHCQSSLALGIWSDPAHIPADVRARLGLLLSRRLGEAQ